ncbi:hypothetical protein [Levilactobacillus huananensis]|uniref:hypothetical protein n=1 Tax=Levilactobacillus huananensis TaxID=2486019 RepID=UPI000F78A55A|nr:hypothetical protein [Levilactobacillus huananensis]
MRIDCRATDIEIERTRSMTGQIVAFDCPDMRLKGDFPSYLRLADFLWDILSQRALPLGIRDLEDADFQGPFIEEGEYFPATITTLDEFTDDSAEYLVTRMSKETGTIYRIRFDLDKNRGSHYGFILDNATVRINEKGQIRELKPEWVQVDGFEMYEDLSKVIQSLVDCGVTLEFSGTDEEEDSMEYLMPLWVDRRNLLTDLRKDGEEYELSYWLPDGSFRVDLTCTLKEITGKALKRL